jgi:hypothetical protein
MDTRQTGNDSVTSDGEPESDTEITNELVDRTQNSVPYEYENESMPTAAVIDMSERREKDDVERLFAQLMRRSKDEKERLKLVKEELKALKEIRSDYRQLRNEADESWIKTLEASEANITDAAERQAWVGITSQFAPLIGHATAKDRRELVNDEIKALRDIRADYRQLRRESNEYYQQRYKVERDYRVLWIESILRIVIAGILVFGIVLAVVLALILGTSATDLSQYLAPITGITGIVIGFFFGRASEAGQPGARAEPQSTEK